MFPQIMSLSVCIVLNVFQELESLRSQVQSQSAEINQLKTERQELLRRAEVGVNIRQMSHTESNIMSQKQELNE